MKRNRSETLAPYAISEDQSGGRVHPEAPDPLRDAFALDRHRIVESAAFRRLEHKTQVFAPALDDHIRTRLTHTLEAALIGRTLARALRANESLTEAIILAHDLGHPPFGHAGEVALNVAMANHGGFNHNAHSLRIVEYLEHPFPPFRGLNLTCATLSGMRVHATRYDVPAESPRPVAEAAMAEAGNATDKTDRSKDGIRPLFGASVEARIASVADRIAYDGHDLEDGIGAGLITRDDLHHLPIWRHAWETHAARYADRPIFAIRRLVLDAILDRVLRDIVAHSSERLAGIHSSAQAESYTGELVAPSVEGEQELAVLEAFLQTNVYRHPEVARADARGHAMILALFDAYVRDPSLLPERFATRIDGQGIHRVVCDYVAGMTDRFCMSEHGRIVGSALNH